MNLWKNVANRILQSKDAEVDSEITPEELLEYRNKNFREMIVGMSLVLDQKNELDYILNKLAIVPKDYQS